MTASLNAGEWLRFVRKEYLDTFVKEGGAAIKFAVPLDKEAHQVLWDGLVRESQQLGFLVARLDARETRIHLADQIFFRVAEQVPWQRLRHRIIARLAEVKDDAAGDRSVEQVASVLGVDRGDLLMELRPKIVNKVFKNRELSKDFRVAMMQLCLAEISGGQDGATAIQVLTDWLTGRNNAVSAVKPYQIFCRINRTNARFMFESLLRWVSFAGIPGVVVLWDTSQLALSRNPRDDSVYYSKAAVLDAYEVLRQFLDGTDRLRGCLMVVVPDVAFLDDFSRGIHAYEALKFRVIDEVRDRKLVNPLASLVRLSSGPN